MKGKKLLGEERREMILEWLKTSSEPITGNELALRANVSRQVVVGDVTILKAKNEPILATSQGYLYMSQPITRSKRIVACSHPPEKTKEELLLLVNLGITIGDVIIEHSVYGDLTASIMVSNPQEVHQFIEKINSTKSAYLSELTNGIHLHTIYGPSEDALNNAEEALRSHGFLIE